jgi:hypothetical protein
MNLIIILFLIGFIIIIGYYIKYNFYKETYSNVNFLSKSELENIIYSNADRYYDRFYQIDWIARKVDSLESYIEMIKTKSICYEFSFKEKDRLTKLINQIEINIKANLNKVDIPIDLLLSTPWNIGLCRGSIYENGFPHTRNLNIILSDIHLGMSDINLSKILRHEKIHIFQKTYPDITEQYLSTYNFKIYGIRTPDSMIRVNPDTTDLIYTNSKNDVMSSKYNSTNPSSINDVSTQSQRDEHPLEWMAIELEEKFI